MEGEGNDKTEEIIINFISDLSVTQLLKDGLSDMTLHIQVSASQPSYGLFELSI